MLQAFATLIRTQLRANDLVARIGGEEFAAVLPATSLDEALEIAERIRNATERLRVPLSGRAVSVTVSIGVASSLGMETLDAMLSSADRALYRGKRDGRNLVRLANPTPRTPLPPALVPNPERLSA